MPEETPHHVCIMEGIRDAIEALELDGKPPVQVRENYWFLNGEKPEAFAGITIHELGEDYDDGVIGLEDVGYRCGVTLVEFANNDGKLALSRGLQWRKPIRNRLKNQRIPVADEDLESVKRHVLRVLPGSPRHPAALNAKYKIRQLLVIAWTRERPDDGEEDV